MVSDKKKSVGNRPSTWPDVVIHIVNTFYNLINSGNFIGGVLLLFFVFCFFIAWRLPPDLLSPHVGKILTILESDKYYIVLLVSALLFSISGNCIQKKVYKAEIKRLTDLRKELIHGKNKHLLKELDGHHPSDFDLDMEDGEC